MVRRKTVGIVRENTEITAPGLFRFDTFQLLTCFGCLGGVGEPRYEGSEEKFCPVLSADPDERKALFEVGIGHAAVVGVSIYKYLVSEYGV